LLCHVGRDSLEIVEQWEGGKERKQKNTPLAFVKHRRRLICCDES